MSTASKDPEKFHNQQSVSQQLLINVEALQQAGLALVSQPIGSSPDMPLGHYRFFYADPSGLPEITSSITNLIAAAVRNGEVVATLHGNRMQPDPPRSPLAATVLQRGSFSPYTITVHTKFADIRGRMTHDLPSLIVEARLEKHDTIPVAEDAALIFSLPEMGGGFGGLGISAISAIREGDFNIVYAARPEEKARPVISQQIGQAAMYQT